MKIWVVIWEMTYLETFVGSCIPQSFGSEELMLKAHPRFEGKKVEDGYYWSEEVDESGALITYKAFEVVCAY